MSPPLQAQAGGLGLRQIQAPSRGLQAKAVALEGVGDRKRTGSESAKGHLGKSEGLRQNLGKHPEHRCSMFEVVLFWVWVFS